MLLLAMILLISVRLGETSPTKEYIKDVTPEDRVLKVLQRIASRPTPEPLEYNLLSHLPMDMANPWLSVRIPSSSWWRHLENPHRETKRRQNLASYNLNSFGLRYGK
ncbi:metastasis-suppressor KiSS-1 [Clarias gariepinus]|uniref:metastasis-suppressor KiSS-1 n=1 Tax=Clarias gariepinus TaxID=13013 RepID=UPI00234D209F|nr:metastasis-suppressor KiSS-1 [Clarias gariepinus]